MRDYLLGAVIGSIAAIVMIQGSLLLAHHNKGAQDMPDQTTKLVRIAVAIGDDGEYYAVGWNGPKGSIRDTALDGYYDCHRGEPHVHWIEADLPLPQEPTVQGVVRADDE